MSSGITFNDIADFLKEEGAIGVILVIDQEEGMMHSEFKKHLHVSRATVTKRLERAQDLDLMEQSRHADDHGNTKRYMLTEMGRVLRVALESLGLRETYQQYVENHRELKQSTEEMVDWIHDNHTLWDQKKYEDEFSFLEEYQTEDAFPGEDVPDQYQKFIEGTPSRAEQIRRISDNLGGSEQISNTGDSDQSSDPSTEDDSEE